MTDEMIKWMKAFVVRGKWLNLYIIIYDGNKEKDRISYKEGNGEICYDANGEGLEEFNKKVEEYVKNGYELINEGTFAKLPGNLWKTEKFKYRKQMYLKDNCPVRETEEIRIGSQRCRECRFYENGNKEEQWIQCSELNKKLPLRIPEKYFYKTKGGNCLEECPIPQSYEMRSKFFIGSMTCVTFCINCREYGNDWIRCEKLNEFKAKENK